jgi:hypothetical protein
MSDLNVTVTTVTSLEPSKEGVATTSKDISKTMDAHQLIKHEHKTKTVPSKLTNLNYSVDHEDKSIHLKVRSSDGEIVREVVFERIDPSLIDPKKLKGVLIDNNA